MGQKKLRPELWWEILVGFPGSANGKEPACLCKRLERGFVGLIPA